MKSFISFLKTYKTGFNYSLVSSVRSIIVGVVGVLSMLWIGPKELGLWSSLSIYLSYLPFLFFGVQSSLNRELPILLGKKNDVEVIKLIGNARMISLAGSTFIFILGIFGVFIALINHAETYYLLGLVAVVIIGVLESFRVHLVATFRSENSFDKLTKIYVVEILFTCLLILIIYKYKYVGLLIYSIFAVFLNVILLFHFSPFRNVKVAFEKKNIYYLFKSGFVLMIFAQLKQAAPTIPKWIILFYGSSFELGLFSPAFAIGSIMIMIPDQIANYISPRIGYKFGENNCSNIFWPHAKKALLILPLITIPFCIMIWVFSPIMLNTFLPKYSESLWAIRIMSLGFIFSSSFLTQTIYYTIKAHYEILFLLLFEILGYLIFPLCIITFLNMNLLLSVAIGISLTSFILFFVNAYLLKITLFKNKYNNESLIKINDD
jgi:O-antigen/teichoic acid export membrane protein